MHNSEAVTLAGGTLDRAAHLRGDAMALQNMQSDPAARAFMMWRGRPLVDMSGAPALVWLHLGADIVKTSGKAAIFIGLQNGAPRFAYDLSSWVPDDLDQDAAQQFLDKTPYQHPQMPAGQEFIELRAVMASLSHADAGDAALVKGIFEWHRYHRYCANCGAPSIVSQAGWQRECPACKRQHFPRTDPVVIMLVLHGNDVLLGRAPNWPEGMYSLLAGYMEPGEGIEEAVRREVFEECGVPIGKVRYLSSQPWPFPASLMIGCRATALARDLTLDPVEIADAKWVSREAVAHAMSGADESLMPSRKGSIARFLLDAWLADDLEG